MILIPSVDLFLTIGIRLSSQIGLKMKLKLKKSIVKTLSKDDKNYLLI